LRADDFTLDNVRFDYARVLISTSSLEILNTEAKVMVDGELFDFKIIEEWDFSLGDDACLDDDVETQVNDDFQPNGVHDEVAANGDVEILLNDLSDD
jgi:hypothetical protein